MKRSTLLILILFVTVVSNAQFIPYSQFQITPVLTNPAAAGMSDYTEITAQYKQSRVANYEIPSLSFIHPLYHSNKMRFGGIGASLVNQSAGPRKLFNMTGIMAGYAHVIHISSKHHVSAGIQGGMVNKRIDASKITTDNQYNLGAYDPSLSTGENFSNTSVTKPVFNAGASWFLTNKQGDQVACLGAAAYNMNTPSYDLLATGSTEMVTWIFSGDVIAWRRDRVSVRPSFRYIVSNSSVGNFGLSAQYKLTGGHEISAGSWYKSNNALVFNLQYSQLNYFIAAAHEFSTGSSQEVNINNSVEVALGWRIKRK